MAFSETVLLKGGPLGGEVRQEPYPALKLRVPVIAPIRYTESESGIHHAVETDEYRFYGRYIDGMRVLEWVRPDMSKLREENRQLRNELEEVTRRLDEVLHGPPPRVGLMRFGR